jgi:hypothetical protein
MHLHDVRQMALALPGAGEGTRFGLPTFNVRSKFFAGLEKMALRWCCAATGSRVDT